MPIANTDDRIFIILFVFLRSSTYPATGVSNYCQHSQQQQQQQQKGPDVHDIYVDLPLVSQATTPQPTSQLIEDRYVSMGSSDIHDIYVDPRRQENVSKTEIHDIHVDPEVNSLRR